MTIDGYVAGPKGELDWMISDWSSDIINYVNYITTPVDTILLGRKMTDGFISYWSNVITQPDNPEYEFGRKMMDTPKVVFSNTLDKSNWPNTVIAKDLVSEINKLKETTGGDIIAYGGAGFVSSLIKYHLIDEYYLFLNPVSIGDGMAIFKNSYNKFDLQFIESTPFKCGIVVNFYRPDKV